MRVGFTGTRQGMTAEQIGTFRQLILDLAPTEFHHGDCQGADDDAALIVDALRAAGRLKCKIVRHPPLDKTHQAHNDKHDEDRPPKTHFARNRCIVDQTQVLVVVPRDSERKSQGGTWYTYDYAARGYTPRFIIWPGGELEEEGT